ncbi:hypothetical protein F5Y15DRAFT_264813 [Xylariaceae sp. FL0016]|nr:hypothetical protein F5Y15DRAFT_264813 [Xylariaceae sp. FL0016]
MAAFAPTEYTYWWAPQAAMHAWNMDRIASRFTDASTRQFKVVDDTAGRIACWAKGDPPAQMRGLRDGFVGYEDGKAAMPQWEDDAGRGGEKDRAQEGPVVEER